ncbi:MAG: hypothetical protein RLZZ241_1360 [Bacteroidota bacterium]|jgi:hypothetical protein
MNDLSLSEKLVFLLKEQKQTEPQEWLLKQLCAAVESTSAKDFFMTYTLSGRKFNPVPVFFPLETLQAAPEFEQFKAHSTTIDQLARIYILAYALEQNPEFFIPKIATLIQVADTGELITFLRYLWALPHANAFTAIAVDALRTNISDVFDAIALNNPFPENQFNEGQWNQMYLKAAFLQRNLLQIQGVAHRANANLARIISDYAHERWAASRTIDPQIWQPVGRFIDDVILGDMKRLLNSSNLSEQRAGFLCCSVSTDSRAKTLIERHPLKKVFEQQPFNWQNL